MARAYKLTDWDEMGPRVKQRLHEGWTATRIAREYGIGPTTLRAWIARQELSRIPEHLLTPPDPDPTEGHPGTLEGYQEVMEDVSQSVPDVPYLSTDAEQSAEQSAHTEADELFDEPNIEVHKPVHKPVQPIDTSVDDSAETSAEHYAPVQTAVQKLDTGPVQTLDTGAVQRIDRLEDDVRQLAQMMRSVMDHFNDIPVQSPVQITAVPSYPKGKSVRWNLWILDSIRDELATIAAERDVSPSQLVQELLWKALRQE